MTMNQTSAPPVLRTARLRLRELQDTDAPFILDLFTQPSFVENIGDRGVHTLDDACAYIHSGPRASYRDRGFGFYAVEPRAGGAPLGICGLVQRDGLDHPDVGFALLPVAWGQGFATEASRATVEWAHEQGHEPVLAIAQPNNRASIRVLEKSGLTPIGTVRLPGDPTELLLFTTAADD